MFMFLKNTTFQFQNELRHINSSFQNNFESGNKNRNWKNSGTLIKKKQDVWRKTNYPLCVRGTYFTYLKLKELHLLLTCLQKDANRRSSNRIVVLTFLLFINKHTHTCALTTQQYITLYHRHPGGILPPSNSSLEGSSTATYFLSRGSSMNKEVPGWLPNFRFWWKFFLCLNVAVICSSPPAPPPAFLSLSPSLLMIHSTSARTKTGIA